MPMNRLSLLTVMIITAGVLLSTSHAAPDYQGGNFYLTSHGDAAKGLPDGEGRLIVEDVCSVCHSVDMVTARGRSREEWQAVVDMMIGQGAPLHDDEIEPVVRYLSENFGKGEQIAN